MFKEECKKFFSSKKSITALSINITLALLHTFDSVYISNFYFEMPDGAKYHPVFASFINGSSAWISYFKSAFVWLAPVMFIIAFCSNYANEKKLGLTNVYLTKVSRKDYFFSKIKVSFIMPLYLCGIPHLLSLLICVIFLHKYTGFMDMQTWSFEEAGWFDYYSVHRPYLTYLIYFISSMLIFGLLGIICQCICFLSGDNRISLIVSEALWLLYFSTSYFNSALQPFQDVGVAGWIVAYASYLPVVLIIFLVTYKLTVKNNDKIY